MRLGLALPHYDTSFEGRPVSWESLAQVARLAEGAGFSSLWMSDHLFLDWSKYGGSSERQGSFEAWSTMSALAAVTKRVRIGSLTLCNDLRNPAMLARMASTLDLLSNGRLDLGLGAGWYEPEYATAGIPFDPPGDRIRRLGEAAHIIRRLLEGEEPEGGEPAPRVFGYEEEVGLHLLRRRCIFRTQLGSLGGDPDGAGVEVA